MDCADEEKLIRKALGDLVAGIEGMDFFLVSGTLRVKYKLALVDTGAIIRAIDRAGFQARVQKLELAVPSWQGRKQIILLGLCGLLAGLGFGLSEAGFGHSLVDPIYLLSYYHRRLLDGQEKERLWRRPGILPPT